MSMMDMAYSHKERNWHKEKNKTTKDEIILDAEFEEVKQLLLPKETKP